MAISDENRGEKLELERFFVKVPDECLEEFLKDMAEQVRTPPQLAAFILVQYYRRKKRADLADLSRQQPVADDPAEIPNYGPKPRRNVREFGEESKGGV